MKKTNFYYFKRAFSLSIFIAVFIIVRDLFDVDFSDWSAILKVITKGIIAGVIAGVILGIINIFYKKDVVSDKKNN